MTTTFARAAEAGRLQHESRQESQPESQSGSQSGSQLELLAESLEWRALGLLEYAPKSRSEISAELGQTVVSGQLNIAFRALLDGGFIERTIPDRPGSRLQKYKLTRKGKNRLARAADGVRAGR